MSTEADNIRTEVTRIAEHASVTYTTTYLGQRKREGWDCDMWACTLTKSFADGDNRAENFDFFTGLGLRAEPTAQDKKQAKYASPGLTDNDMARGTIYARNYLAKLESLRKPQPPHIADLVHSLILDSSAASQSFESWCSDFGYDVDSRKALATYEACQRNADKLCRVFNANDITTLQAALQDY